MPVPVDVSQARLEGPNEIRSGIVSDHGLAAMNHGRRDPCERHMTINRATV